MNSLTRAQVRAIDRRAAEEFGVPSRMLMENAGRGAAQLLKEFIESENVYVICGKGNNGGDGLVMANDLNHHDIYTYVVMVDDAALLSGDALHAYDRYRLAWPNGFSNLEHHKNAWYVDALFGTGLSRPVTGKHADIIKLLNSYGIPILALDIPSGLDCDSGEPLGVAVKATHTATFVARKVGFDNPASLGYTGEVHVIDIGVPLRLVEQYM